MWTATATWNLYQPAGYGLDLDKLWIQTSPGVFVNKADTLLPTGLMSRAASAHFGDLDGDGDMDLIVMEWLTPASTVPSRALMYTNDGTGKFTFAAAQPDPSNITPTDRMPPTLTGRPGHRRSYAPDQRWEPDHLHRINGPTPSQDLPGYPCDRRGFGGRRQ